MVRLAQEGNTQMAGKNRLGNALATISEIAENRQSKSVALGKAAIRTTVLLQKVNFKSIGRRIVVLRTIHFMEMLYCKRPCRVLMRRLNVSIVMLCIRLSAVLVGEIRLLMFEESERNLFVR